jgi:hypothetical protein
VKWGLSAADWKDHAVDNYGDFPAVHCKPDAAIGSWSSHHCGTRCAGSNARRAPQSPVPLRHPKIPAGRRVEWVSCPRQIRCPIMLLGDRPVPNNTIVRTPVGPSRLRPNTPR